jgi:hypothetical protein
MYVPSVSHSQFLQHPLGTTCAFALMVYRLPVVLSGLLLPEWAVLLRLSVMGFAFSAVWTCLSVLRGDL